MEAAVLIVVARIKAKAGREAEVQAALLDLVAPTRQEPGCLQYDLHQSLEDPTLFLFYERWRSRPDLETHLQQPYIQAFLRRSDDLLSEPVAITSWRLLAGC